MARKKRPTIENPLANMGLDQIVRGITAPKNDEDVERHADRTTENKSGEPVKSRRGGLRKLQENLEKYRGINEQGAAIWLPTEVKKKLDMIRVNASRNIPLRSLAAAIIMTYIAENEEKLKEL